MRPIALYCVPLMTADKITIAEASARLGIDRSNVLRRARRGDFGELVEIGIGERPSLILISADAVDAFAAAS